MERKNPRKSESLRMESRHCIATKHNSYRRTLVEEDVCDICGVEKEDEFHATVKCTRSRALRQEMRAHWNITKEAEFTHMGPDWLQNLLLANIESVRNRVLLMLWQCWNLRNNVIHGDKKHSLGSGTVFNSIQ